MPKIREVGLERSSRGLLRREDGRYGVNKGFPSSHSDLPLSRPTPRVETVKDTLELVQGRERSGNGTSTFMFGLLDTVPGLPDVHFRDRSPTTPCVRHTPTVRDHLGPTGEGAGVYEIRVPRPGRTRGLPDRAGPSSLDGDLGQCTHK